MRLLTRYVLFEIIKVFLIALTGMTLFLLLVGVSKEAYQQGLGLKQILLLLPYVLPESLRFAVPGTILFAACSVYGRMASSNEVVAVKSMGISPWTILLPTFVFAFLLSLTAVWLNDVACSWGRDGARRVVIESVEEIVYARLQQQRSYSTHQFSINVRGVNGRKLVQPTFTFAASEDSPAKTITAEEAELKSDLAAGTLTIVCRDGTLDVGGARCVFPYAPPLELVIPLDDASKKGGTRGASDLPLHQIPEEAKAQAQQIELDELEMALAAGEQALSGDFASLTSPQWVADDRHLGDERVKLYRLQMEPSRRWANGFSCLCFVLLGAPMAILLRNTDFLTSFFACFLPILLVYYPLLILGVDLAKRGLPPALVWTGNAMLLASGAWLMRRVLRY